MATPVKAVINSIEAGKRPGAMSGAGTSPEGKRPSVDEDAESKIKMDGAGDVQNAGTSSSENQTPGGSAFDFSDFAAKLQPFMKKACEEAVATRFQVLEDRVSHVETFGPRISDLEGFESRIQALEMKREEGSSGGGSFCPSFVELKVCEWDDRKEKGVDRKKAERFVEQLRSVLPEELKPHFKNVSLGGAMNHKIKIATTPSFTFELRGVLEEQMAQHGFQVNEAIPKIFVERPPEIQAMYKLFGKLADLSRAAVADKPQLKLDVQPQWTACFLEVEGKTVHPLIGEVPKDSTEIILNEECLQEYFGMTKEQFLLQRRRR